MITMFMMMLKTMLKLTTTTIVTRMMDIMLLMLKVWFDDDVEVASLLEEYFLEGLPEVLVEHRVDHLTNKILILAQ